MTITAYRITKKDFAATSWSGIGARDFGGRWNSKGVSVIYTAQSRSLAAIEQLVHLVKPRILKGYVIASIEIEQTRIQQIDTATLPSGWSNPVALPGLKKYGDDWITAATFPALAVPSAVIAGEWNYLVNPAHPEFSALATSRPIRFEYDDRLG